MNHFLSHFLFFLLLFSVIFAHRVHAVTIDHYDTPYTGAEKMMTVAWYGNQTSHTGTGSRFVEKTKKTEKTFNFLVCSFYSNIANTLDFKGEETPTPGKLLPEIKNEIPSNLNTTQKISREKALELAAQFLKNQNAEWGTPVGIIERARCYNFLTKKERGNTPDKIWDFCYIVTYPTEETFIQLKGAKGVVVSNDGSKIIFAPLE